MENTEWPGEVGFFSFDGHALCYESYGEGPRLFVFTHGLLLDAALSRPLARALARRGHRVVLPELLGHGRSDAPRHASEYRIDVYGEQIFALLDALGADEAVIGGVSLGANASLHAAVRRPERVRGLVVEMPVLEWATPAAALAFVPLLLMVHYGDRPARLLNRVARSMPRPRSDVVESLLNAVSTPPEVMASILHGILVGPVAPTVDERRTIEAPALVLAHRFDLIHPFSDAENLARQLPNAGLVRAHSPLELRVRPERLTQEIDAFLRGAWGPRSLAPSQPTAEAG